MFAAECIVGLLVPNDSDAWYCEAVVGAYQLVEAKGLIKAIAKGLSNG